MFKIASKILLGKIFYCDVWENNLPPTSREINLVHSEAFTWNNFSNPADGGSIFLRHLHQNYYSTYCNNRDGNSYWKGSKRRNVVPGGNGGSVFECTFFRGYLRSQVSSRVIYGGQNSSGTVFYPNSSNFSCHYHSIYAPCSFVHLSPMLRAKSWQLTAQLNYTQNSLSFPLGRTLCELDSKILRYVCLHVC